MTKKQIDNEVIAFLTNIANTSKNGYEWREACGLLKGLTETCEDTNLGVYSVLEDRVRELTDEFEQKKHDMDSLNNVACRLVECKDLLLRVKLLKDNNDNKTFTVTDINRLLNTCDSLDEAKRLLS